MKHVLMFAADDGGSGGSGGGGSDDFENAAELRDKVRRLAAMLSWHVENTPLATWRKTLSVTNSYNLEGHSALLHTLYNNRPKRQATLADISELASLLVKQRREAPTEMLQMLATDPDWHIFQLRLDVDPPMTEGEI